jgi:hypothetical protein
MISVRYSNARTERGSGHENDAICAPDRVVDCGGEPRRDGRGGANGGKTGCAADAGAGDSELAQELHLTGADLKAMPRTTLTAMDAHEKQTHTFEGVTLAELLKRAGVPSGENLRGKSMTMCVVAGAADGYHAVFSLAELDASIGGVTVLVADTVDGQPIPAGQGPLRLVVPSDKRPARWVRMLQSLTVFSVAAGK